MLWIWKTNITTPTYLTPFLLWSCVHKMALSHWTKCMQNETNSKGVKWDGGIENVLESEALSWPPSWPKVRKKEKKKGGKKKNLESTERLTRVGGICPGKPPHGTNGWLLRGTWHTGLGARDQATKSTLIGGKGGDKRACCVLWS